MPAPIFASVGGLPLPLLPMNEQGVERVADGQSVLNLQQAAVKFRATEDALRLLYCSHWDQAVAATGKRSATADVLYEAARLSGLHKVAYPELSGEEFAALVAFCRSKKIDPERRWVYPKRVYGEAGEGSRLDFRLRIDAMRWLATETGELAAIGGGEYIYDRDEGHPFRVSVTVTRRVKGNEVAYTARAEWDEHYPGPSDFWDRMPVHMLEKCAEAKALRKAFPDQLTGVYSDEETMVKREPKRSESGEYLSADEAHQAHPADDGDPHRRRPWPTTAFEFELALVDCGLKQESVRQQVAQRLRRDTGHRGTESTFYRKGLAALYGNPSKYGATLPVADGG